MRNAKLPAHAIAPLILLASAGCATEPRHSAYAGVKPVSQIDGIQASGDEGLYQEAVKAITQRDYGLALEFLQAARARNPHDVRVLNAFGVVYDKLGRFDLSAGYYRQAQAVEPDSKIVAQNFAYSRLLQTESDALAVSPVVASNAPPQQPTAVAQSVARSTPQSAAPSVAQSAPSVVPAASPVAQPAPAPAAVAEASVQTPAVISVSPNEELRLNAPSYAVTPAAVLDEPVADASPAVQLERVVDIAPVRAPAALTPTSPPAPTASLHPAQAPLLVEAAASPQLDHLDLQVVDARAPDAPWMLQPAAYRTGRVAPEPALAARSVDESHERVQPQAEPVRPAPATGTAPLAMATSPVAARDPTPAAPTRPSPVAGHRAPDLIVRPRRGPVSIGARVIVVNATGHRWGAEGVRRRLGHLGWSMRASWRWRVPQGLTTIMYRRADMTVARALARSLPGHTRLVACRSCSGVRLVLGSDVARWAWNWRARALAQSMRRGIS
jgi:Flp pilus assembly protein TadD